MKKVWVELDADQQPVRIFRSRKAAFSSMATVVTMDKAKAIGAIRRQVYNRQKGLCLNCAAPVTWDGNLFERMHLDEIISRGKGGEVSLANCQGLCADCHIGPQGKHSDRQPQFGKRTND